MARIETAAELDQFEKQLSSMPNEILLSQEIMQKGAIHALDALLREGCTEQACRAMLRTYKRLDGIVSEESARRGLPVVESGQQERARP